MSADLFFEMGWKSTLCVAAIFLLLRACRQRPATERSRLAHAGLLAVLLLPVGSTWLAPLTVDVERIGNLAEAPPASADMQKDGLDIRASSSGSVSAEPSTPMDARWLMWIYAGGVLAALAPIGTGFVRLQALHRRARRLDRSPWPHPAQSIPTTGGGRRSVHILVSDEVAAPISWGFLQPVVVLDPATASSPDASRAAIVHEVAHVAHGDWLKLLLGRATTAVFWCNPGVWLLERQCHELRELAADDAVLHAGFDGPGYAELLVAAARRHLVGRFAMSHGIAPRRSELHRRIECILDSTRPRKVARRGATTAGALALLVAGASLAAAEPASGVTFAPDRREGVGERAAMDLGRVDHPQARALARAILEQDWDARRAAGPTVMRDPAVIEPLRMALEDRQPVIRRLAIWGLSEVRPAPGRKALHAIEQHLEDPSPEVRAEAARALGDHRATQSAASIARLLRDDSAWVRRQAAHALGDLQQVGTRTAVATATADPEPAVRARAVWALARIDEAAALSAPLSID